MKKNLVLSFAALVATAAAQAQTKFGDNKATINGSSLVEMESINKGLLPPRVTLTDKLVWGLATNTPATGMVVYSNATGANGLDTGLVVWQGQWNPLAKSQQHPYTTMDGSIGTAGSAKGIISVPGAGLRVDNGFYSHAEGLNDTALNGAFVIGSNNSSNAAQSFVAGSLNKIRGNMPGSAVMGASNQITNPSNAGTGSMLLGTNNTLTGDATSTGMNGIFITGTDNKVIAAHLYPTPAAGTTANAHLISGTQNQIISGTSSAILGHSNTDSLGQRNMIGGAFNKIGGGGTSNVLLGHSNSLASYQSTGTVIAGYANTIDIQRAPGAPSTGNLVSGSANTLAGSGGMSANLVGGRSNNMTTALNRQADCNLITGSFNALYATTSTARYNLVSGSYNTLTDVHNAFVAGQRNTITSTMQDATVVGRWNAIVDNALFAIGNGNLMERKNAFVVTSTQTTGATTNGLVIMSGQLPKYPDATAAIADASLPSGAFYKVNGAVYQKD